MKRRLVVGSVLIALLAATSAAGPIRGEPAATGERAFLPLLRVGPALGPTLGPSPTPTRAPTPGPTPPPTDTPGQTCAVLTAGAPERAAIGETVAFTIGILNYLGTPAQVTLRDTIPAQMEAAGIFAPAAPTTAGNVFTLTLTVAPHSAENVFVFAVARDLCDCQTYNTVAWSASWDGGSVGGLALSNPIRLTAAPTPTPLQPTPTPTRVPTLGPSPTPGG